MIRSDFLLDEEADELVHLFFDSEFGKVQAVPHTVGKDLGEALPEDDLVRVPLRDLFLRGSIAAAVAETDGYALVFVGVRFCGQAVKRDHVRPVFVDISAVGVIDHIRREAAGGTKVRL